jgi:hypothetical protein
VLAVLVLALIAFERGTKTQLAVTPGAPQQRIAAHGVSDDPISLEDEDALGLVPIARALSRFLRNVETKPTVAVGITGPWGSGKSSLMNLVREDLADYDVRTVWFNAWHHQKEDNLLAALLATIRAQAVPPIWTLTGVQYRLRIAWRRIIEDAGRSITFMVLFAVAAALVFTFGSRALDVIGDTLQWLGALMQTGSAESKSPPSAAQAITSIGLSTGGIGGVLYGVKHIWDLFKPLKTVPSDLVAEFSDQSRVKDLDAQLSFRYRFTREFATFCDTLRWPPFPGLVIFVDDLDRCGTQQAVDVLEAINFITSAGKCFVVLGFDENKVKAAIADVYKKTLLRLDENSTGPIPEPGMEDLFRFATNYLEKLVHLIVPVPRAGLAAVEQVLGVGGSAATAKVDRRALRRRKLASEIGGGLLVGLFLIATALFTIGILTSFVPPQRPLLTPAELEQTASGCLPSPKSSPMGTGNAQVQERATASSPLDDRSLLERLQINPQRALWAMPASIPVAVVLFLIVILALQYVARLSPDPLVKDSDDFREALRIWAPVIAARRTTPRSVKRMINRLRFLAMRVSDLEQSVHGGTAMLREPWLVTYASIEEANPEWLGKEREDIEVESHRTIPINIEERSLVLNGLAKFKNKFGNPYADYNALTIYRAVAGLVEERQPADESALAVPVSQSDAVGAPVA